MDQNVRLYSVSTIIIIIIIQFCFTGDFLSIPVIVCPPLASVTIIRWDRFLHLVVLFYETAVDNSPNNSNSSKLLL